MAMKKAKISELERMGARSPTARLPEGWLEQRVNVKADVVAALLAERESGRSDTPYPR